jgi:sec-independent protein translocase protein TatA
MILPTLAFLQNISPIEWIVILVAMLLLFGRRLPEVGKSLGKGIVEFKKGLSGMEDEVKNATQAAGPPQSPWVQQNQQLPANPVTPPLPQGQPNTVGRDAGH